MLVHELDRRLRAILTLGPHLLQDVGRQAFPERGTQREPDRLAGRIGIGQDAIATNAQNRVWVLVRKPIESLKLLGKLSRLVHQTGQSIGDTAPGSTRYMVRLAIVSSYLVHATS